MSRRDRDFYPTPFWVTRPLLEHIEPFGVILEPCCGDGAIARQLERFGRVIATDIEPHNSCSAVCDFEEAIHTYKPDWVITNPPFSAQWRYLEAAIAVDYGAVLLRATALVPGKRSRFPLSALARRVSNIIFIGPPPSFTGDGKTDFTGVVWVVWGPKATATRLDFVWVPPHDRGGRAKIRKSR